MAMQGNRVHVGLFLLVVIASSLSPVFGWCVADWSAALRTQPLDQPLLITETIGQLPSDFPAGILYKAGPARFENEGSGTAYAHWLEGDGAVARLELNPLSSNCADFTFKFVETELFRDERREGKVLTRGTFGTNKDEGINAFDFRLRNPCNTNAVRVGDKVLALSEVGLPQVLDPDTLEARGVETFGDRLVDGAPAATLGVLGFIDSALGFGDAVCAHHREIDGRHAFVSMRQNAVTDATCLTLLEIDSHSGDVVSETESELENTGFPPHDWVVTPNYAAFVATPAGGNLIPFLIGLKGPAECISFQDNSSAIVHFVPRTGEAAVKSMSVKLPVALHPIHFANAWNAKCETDNEPQPRGVLPKMEILATCWDDDTVKRMGAKGESLLGSWSKVSRGDFDGVPVQRLVRITAAGGDKAQVKEAVPDLGHVDYVKCHPGLTGLQSRYVWGSLAATEHDEPAPLAPPQCFVRLDLDKKRKVDEWFAGERRFVDDFVLVEKNSRKEAEEPGDETGVWLLAPIFDSETKTSSFVVLDGQDISAGPVFEAQLSSHIPWGLHGTYTLR